MSRLDVGKALRELHRLPCADEIMNVVTAEMAKLGIEVTTYHRLIDKLAIVPIDSAIVFHNFPLDWVEEYIREGYSEVDPILAALISATGPFHWFEVHKLLPITPPGQAYLNRLREFGFVDGIAVPVSCQYGSHSFFGYGSMTAAIDASEIEIIEMSTISQTAHMKITELSKVTPRLAASLSSREKQILSLAAGGASNRQIATGLAISPATVDTLFRRIFLKLDVNTRVEAVVAALRAGAVSLRRS